MTMTGREFSDEIKQARRLLKQAEKARRKGKYSKSWGRIRLLKCAVASLEDAIIARI